MVAARGRYSGFKLTEIALSYTLLLAKGAVLDILSGGILAIFKFHLVIFILSNMTMTTTMAVMMIMMMIMMMMVSDFRVPNISVGSNVGS